MKTIRSGCPFIALLLVLAAVARAQPAPFGLGQDLRLQGIVEPAEGAKTLGTIKIRAGDVVRRFGVVRAQTPRAEGMSLFNRSELHHEQLLLRGSRDQMATFQNAPAGTTLRMLGRYQGDDYLLAEITAGDPTPAAK
ncbi:MAG TPA: hypothetical protein VL049_22300 [Candidatus Dormibacteraeota bacterium]|nr:hypothetical protein [Candidatus Dormibacteraeota bacterium]